MPVLRLSCACAGRPDTGSEAGREAGRTLHLLVLLLAGTTLEVLISKPAPGVVQSTEEVRGLPQPMPPSPVLTLVSFLSLQGRSFWRQPQTNSHWRRRRHVAGRWVRSWQARGSSTQLGAQGWMPVVLAGWPTAVSATPSSPPENAAAGPCRVSKPSSSSATRQDSLMPRADTMRTAFEVKRGTPPACRCSWAGTSVRFREASGQRHRCLVGAGCWLQPTHVLSAGCSNARISCRVGIALGSLRALHAAILQ